LSLIAGSPQSFIQDISQPLYARRPVVGLPQSAMLTPQTQEATMVEENAPPPAAPAAGVVGGVPGGIAGPVGSGSGAGGSAYELTSPMNATKRGLSMYEQMGAASKTDRFHGSYNKWLDQDVRYIQDAAAESRDLGDYFEYNIKQSITIGKNQSALVPILQSRIEAEKVTLWSADANQPPLRALWIKNSSGLTLDSGTFNIIDSGTFAGEGLIATVHPDERRLLSYAADTAVRVTAESEFKNQPATHIRLAKGVMLVTREQRNKIKYTIRNADTAARQVVIEHPVREGWKLVDDNKPEETSAAHYRFRVAVDPNKTNELTVEEFHQELTRSMLTDLTQDQLDALVVENHVTPALKDAFHRVLEQKNQIYFVQSDIESRQQELTAINRDQARVRENMKVLKGSAEEKALLLRYTKQLDSQEDRLAALNKEISELEQKKSQEQLKLDAMVQEIALDESF
jgi:hypothetical protein